MMICYKALGHVKLEEVMQGIYIYLDCCERERSFLYSLVINIYFNIGPSSSYEIIPYVMVSHEYLVLLHVLCKDIKNPNQVPRNKFPGDVTLLHFDIEV